jgi:hypothetical protein
MWRPDAPLPSSPPDPFQQKDKDRQVSVPDGAIVQCTQSAPPVDAYPLQTGPRECLSSSRTNAYFNAIRLHP